MKYLKKYEYDKSKYRNYDDYLNDPDIFYKEHIILKSKNKIFVVENREETEDTINVRPEFELVDGKAQLLWDDEIKRIHEFFKNDSYCDISNIFLCFYKKDIKKYVIFQSDEMTEIQYILNNTNDINNIEQEIDQLINMRNFNV